MQCPYCDNEMEEGALRSRVVPEWVKKGEKRGQLLNCEKHFSYNALVAYRCDKCKKIILND